MPRISCLHTADSNIQVFEAARRLFRLDDVVMRHRVRADLLAAAEKAGGAVGPVLQRTAAELGLLAEGADAVLLACSTLGPAAALAQAATSVPVLRVDQALAEAAVKRGGTVIVLCAAGTTIAPTRTLFERVALLTGAEVEVRLVPGAWERFQAGDEAATCRWSPRPPISPQRRTRRASRSPRPRWPAPPGSAARTRPSPAPPSASPPRSPLGGGGQAGWSAPA